MKHLKKKVDRKLVGKKELNLSNTYLTDLAKQLNINYGDLVEFHYALHDYDHVKCFYDEEKGTYIGLDEKGLGAVVDKFWLREGQKELNERIYDKAKWTVPIISLMVTIIALTISTWQLKLSTEELYKQKEQLRTLSLKVELLSDSVSHQDHHK